MTQSAAGCHWQLACQCPCRALSVEALADKPPEAPVGPFGAMLPKLSWTLS